MMRWILILLSLTACQLKPTKVSEVQHREFNLLVDKTTKPIELSDKTVVLDARSHFDYGLNRVANSLHFPWENLAENALSGEVLRDKRKAALRLSLNGLEPSTPVVVVGYGPRGQGEEGRLAWTLLLLGFNDVQVAGIDMFRKNLTQTASEPAKNVNVWPVQVRETLEIGRDEFAELAFNPRKRLEKKIFLIDVRSEAEYFNKANTVSSKTGPAPDINAIHIEWTEFYTASGRPNPKMKTRLQALGITPNDRVIFIAKHGVRSGAAAYALIALGYQRVQNYTGGWRQLLQ